MFNPFLPDATTLEDIFAAWVIASHEAGLAWDTWLASTIRDRGDAYARCCTSLDREEDAAALLATAARVAPRRLGATDWALGATD
jgi:hypothetical protein